MTRSQGVFSVGREVLIQRLLSTIDLSDEANQILKSAGGRMAAQGINCDCKGKYFSASRDYWGRNSKWEQGMTDLLPWTLAVFASKSKIFPATVCRSSPDLSSDSDA